MTTFAWHVHHEVLVEPLTEPIENRIAYIKAYKPRHEQATRLRLLRIVKGELPAAYAARDKAYAARDKADAARDKAYAARDKADADNLPAILALHAVECEPDCPWDGRSIFG